MLYYISHFRLCTFINNKVHQKRNEISIHLKPGDEWKKNSFGNNKYICFFFLLKYPQVSPEKADSKLMKGRIKTASTENILTLPGGSRFLTL